MNNNKHYAAKGFPWSIGTGTNVKDCTTSQEVIEKAGLDFDVQKCELVAKMPFNINGNNNIDDDSNDFAYKGNIFRECPNAYATYRTDTNIPLGIVKDQYHVIQNKDAFNFFDEAIGEGKAEWQSAGYLGFGERIFITAKIPFKSDIYGDKVDNYLVFSNSHDGSMSINIMFTPIRVACTNMLNGALKQADSYIRIRHTKTAKERLEQGARILRIACEYAESSQELYKSLACIDMKEENIKNYIASVILKDDYNKIIASGFPYAIDKLFDRDYITMEKFGISMVKCNTINKILDYYKNGIGQEEIKGTAWGAYNAITGYYCNVHNMDGERRMNSLLYGNYQTLTNNALNLALDYKQAI